MTSSNNRENSISYSSDGVTLISVSEDIEHLVIKEGVRVISSEACYKLENLKTIQLPHSLRKIESFAFTDCDALESIYIPKNVEEIGSHFFHNCKNIRKIEVNAENEHFFVSDGCLYSKNLFTKSLVRVAPQRENRILKISENVSVYPAAISYCEHLEEVVFPTDSGYIPEDVCAGCSNLTTVVLPARLQQIGNYAFWACVRLVNIKLPPELRVIGVGAFSGTNIRPDFTQLPLLETINTNAFYGCEGIDEVFIPKNIKEIGISAFAITASSITVDKENKHYSSKDGVLYDYEGKILLQYPSKKIEPNFGIPFGVERLGSLAFFHNSHLKSIVFPHSLMELSRFGDSITNCENLQFFQVPSDHSVFSTHNGALYNSDFSVLVCYPSGRNEPDDFLFLPFFTQEIYLGAFSGKLKFKKISVPESLQYLTDSVKAKLNALSDVEIIVRKEYKSRYLSYDSHEISIEELHSKAKTNELGLFGINEFTGFEETVNTYWKEELQCYEIMMDNGIFNYLIGYVRAEHLRDYVLEVEETKGIYRYFDDSINISTGIIPYYLPSTSQLSASVQDEMWENFHNYIMSLYNDDEDEIDPSWIPL